MTTSQATDWMNHPVIRSLIDQAATLALEERITLVKGLIPGIVDALSEEEYEQFVTFIRLKGERSSRRKPIPARAGPSATSPASVTWKDAEVVSDATDHPYVRSARSRPWTCWTLMAGLAIVFGCGSGRDTAEHAATGAAVATPDLADKVAQYTPVRLTADLGGSHREGAADDPAPDRRRAGDGRDLLAGGLRRADRCSPASPIPPPAASSRSTTARGTGWTTTARSCRASARSRRARFYPADMTKEEFESGGESPDGRALGPLHRRPPRQRGGLVAVPYHEAFEAPIRRAAAAPARGRRARRGRRAAQLPRAARPGAARPTTTGRATWPGWT